MSEFEGDGLSNEDFEKSLKRFEDMISTGAQYFFDADELEEIIDYYMQWFNLELAKKALDFALEQYPYSSSIKIKLAQYLSSQHKTREALDLLNEIEEVESTNSELYMTRGYIYSQTGLSEQAIENYKKAKEKNLDIKVITISTKKGEENIVPSWKYTKEKQFDDFINTNDPFTISRYSTLYDIQTTPQLYVLDENKVIRSKGIEAKQLDEVIDYIMKEEADKITKTAGNK